MSVTHRIRRQRWQVTTASAGDAFAVRTALRQENELNVLPALESAFAALDRGDREIHLPRLELSIRISSPERLAEELPAKLSEAARQALTEVLAAEPEMSASTSRDLTPAGRLRRYLNSGQVDWFDAERDHAQLRQQLADEAMQWSAAPAAAWPCLLVDLPSGGAGRRDAFFRFLQLLDDAARAAWWDFGARLAAARGSEFEGAMAALRKLQAARPADHALRLQVLGLLLLAADPAGSSRRRTDWADAMQACAGALGALSTVDRENWLKIETLFDEDKGRSAPGRDVRRESPEALRGVDQSSGKFEISPNFPVDREQTLGLPLRSAGLILLHPYLPRLFAALGWVGESHPQGEPFPWPYLPRAAALLNWLATGRDEPFEFELGTAKLLLGLNPDDALPVAAGLIGEAEQEEGEALLRAVVEHWSALGKTSIDGLRLAFLQRGGLLYPAADGWLLRPQAETFDLLIDRLPWGISIIRLPWMPRSLHTEWLSA
jgi:hypothetical protein